jgi:hypothetical protein
MSGKDSLNRAKVHQLTQMKNRRSFEACAGLESKTEKSQ